jgi:hypothetical protein
MTNVKQDLSTAVQYQGNLFRCGRKPAFVYMYICLFCLPVPSLCVGANYISVDTTTGPFAVRALPPLGVGDLSATSLSTTSLMLTVITRNAPHNLHFLLA